MVSNYGQHAYRNTTSRQQITIRSNRVELNKKTKSSEMRNTTVKEIVNWRNRPERSMRIIQGLGKATGWLRDTAKV